MELLYPTFFYGIVKANIVESVLIFLLLFLSTLCVYFKFQNKRKNLPPGPVGVPVLGYLPFLGSEPHKTLWKMKEKYGDILGLYLGSKYTIIINEWSAAKEILCHAAVLYRAPNIFSHIPYGGFVTANGKEWLEQRRFCLSAIRNLGIGKGPWENIIMEEVQSFMNYLRKQDGKPIDISHDLSLSLASNIISFLIGRRLKKEEEPDKVQLSIDFADVSLIYTGPSNVTTVVPWLRKYFEAFKVAGYDKAAKVIRNFSEFLKDEISRHKSSEEFRNVHDFINTYLERISEMTSTSEKTEHYFSESNLIGHLNMLFLGGSDTIFSSLGWVFRLMSEYKDVQEKVYNELLTVLGVDGIARYEEREKIPYTFAVIMESQRFSSIVPLSTTRRVNQDISVRGYVIPKDAEIVANTWGLHNDPKYWDEPEAFKPERFLTNGGSTLIKFPESYAPFSTGRRNCPGETIALMEILLYFSEIIKRFEVSTALGVKPDFTIINGLVAHLAPQPLCFKERTHN